MKKLVLETTAPFQGLPELVAYDEGLFAKEGLDIEWADREAGVEKKVEASVTTPKASPLRQPRQAARAGQGRHVQRLRMGQLLPRRRYRRAAAASSAGAPSSPIPRSWCGRIRQSTRRSNSPTAPSAYRSISAATISRCICSEASAARHDQAVPGAERLTLPARRDDEGRNRSDHAVASPISRSPRRKAAASSARRSITAPKSRPTASMPRPMPPSIAPCARRCAGSTPIRKPICTTSSTHYAAKDPEIAALKVEDLRESRLVVCDPAPIPLGRNAAHLRLAQELGHARGHGFAAATGEYAGAGLRPRSRGIAQPRNNKAAE